MAHVVTEFIRQIPLGERLLLSPFSGTQQSFSGSWYYEVRTPSLVLASGTPGGSYEYLDLTSGTYGAQVGRTLHFVAYSGTAPSGSPLLLSSFHLAGAYEDVGVHAQLAGLLGENVIIDAPSGTDYQSGHLRRARIRTYQDAVLSLLADEFELDRRYVQDFVPDHRFQVDRQSQREV